MLLNNKVLLTAVVVFMTSGCVNNKLMEQQTQIINLQGELVTAQKNHLQTQAELQAKTEALSASNTEIKSLSGLLAESAESAESVASPPEPSEINVVPLTIDNKSIMGQLEWVYISALKSNFRSRIDTGAATSSLNAIDISRFERDGKKWVRFNLPQDNNDKPEIIEAKIVRFVRIIQAGQSEDDSIRIVVRLHIRAGEIEQATDFTLADRSNMDYPVLIGRSFLQDMAIVDVSQEYIHSKYKAK